MIDDPTVNPNELRRLEISASMSPRTAEVKLDGERWHGLRSLSFKIGPGHLVVVNATFYAQIDGRLDVRGTRLLTLSNAEPVDAPGDTDGQPG